MREAGSVLDVKEAISTSDTGGLVECGRRPVKKIGVHRTTRRSPHCLRHACAAHLLAEGFSLKEIADQLGHRALNVTRTYAKVDVTSLRSVADFDLGGLR